MWEFYNIPGTALEKLLKQYALNQAETCVFNRGCNSRRYVEEEARYEMRHRSLTKKVSFKRYIETIGFLFANIINLPYSPYIFAWPMKLRCQTCLIWYLSPTKRRRGHSHRQKRKYRFPSFQQMYHLAN